MPDAGYFKKLRKKLWKKNNGKCECCGKDTILPEKGINANFQPDNMATIDHLYCRYHPLRKVKPKPGERRLFLFCYRCNQNKGEFERLWYRMNQKSLSL